MYQNSKFESKVAGFSNSGQFRPIAGKTANVKDLPCRKTYQSGENIYIHSEFCPVDRISTENSVLWAHMTFGAVKGLMSCELTGHYNLRFMIARGTSLRDFHPISWTIHNLKWLKHNCTKKCSFWYRVWYQKICQSSSSIFYFICSAASMLLLILSILMMIMTPILLFTLISTLPQFQ